MLPVKFSTQYLTRCFGSVCIVFDMLVKTFWVKRFFWLFFFLFVWGGRIIKVSKRGENGNKDQSYELIKILDDVLPALTVS